MTWLDESSPLTEQYTTGFTSPFYMPRLASRITLEVTGVRVERLHQITESDARAEGLESDSDMAKLLPHNLDPVRSLPSVLRGARWRFVDAWDRINCHRAPWSSNPLVTVIMFRRIDA